MVEFNYSSVINKSNDSHKEVLSEYLIWLKKRAGKGNNRLAESTIYSRLQLVSKFLHDTSFTFEKFSADIIEDYLADFNTRGGYLSRLKNFAKFSFKKGYIEHKPLTDIIELDLKNIKTNENINDPEKEKRYAIPHERWHEIYNKCKTPQIRFAIWLCLNFGLRRIEAINVNVKDVDLKGKRLHITTSKTEKGIRTFPLQSMHVKIFNEYLTKRKSQNLPHDYLIYSKRSKKRLNGNLLYKWCSEIELEFKDNGKTFKRKLTPHTLRRSFLTYVWIKTGENQIYAVSRLAGHSSIQITENYLRLSQDDLFDRCNKVMKDSFA